MAREEAKGETKENQGRKRPRNSTGSQTDEDDPRCSCHNMAASIEMINQKLDLALTRSHEVDVLKENLKDLQKENNDLKDSLLRAQRNCRT